MQTAFANVLLQKVGTTGNIYYAIQVFCHPPRVKLHLSPFTKWQHLGFVLARKEENSWKLYVSTHAICILMHFSLCRKREKKCLHSRGNRGRPVCCNTDLKLRMRDYLMMEYWWIFPDKKKKKNATRYLNTPNEFCWMTPDTNDKFVKEKTTQEAFCADLCVQKLSVKILFLEKISNKILECRRFLPYFQNTVMIVVR